jgi:hypothetical protein
VVYTSASTGVPRGVIGLRAGTVNRLAWGARSVDTHRPVRRSPRSTLNIVDGSTELLGPLMYGGHIVMATARVAQSPQLRIPARAMHAGPTRQGRGRVRSISGS